MFLQAHSNNLSPHCLKSPPNSHACQLLIKYIEAFVIAIKNVKSVFYGQLPTKQLESLGWSWLKGL